MPASEILCVGEVLWDALPAGLFLGGAPFNVACHLRALGVPVGMVSRVGADRLGREAVQRVRRHGIGTELIQVDPELPTGFVCVTLDAQGNAEYDIVAPAAWDAIEPTDAVLRRAAAARAIVFGSLAQRAVTTRDTIELLWETGALKVFDVNLRSPYHSPEIVERSLRRSNVVKLNHEELRQLASWFGLPDAPRAATAALAERFGCEIVCVTRGSSGAALWRDGRWTEHPGFRVEVADTVGAGDAFLAAVLAELLDGRDDLAALRRANLIGAYVATQPGAVPGYDGEAIARIVDASREGVRRLPSTAAERAEAHL
jgi:fructokinase